MSGNNTGKHYMCSICGSFEHTKPRHNEYLRPKVQHEVENQTEKLCKLCHCILPISLFSKNIKKYRRTEYIYYSSRCKKCNSKRVGYIFRRRMENSTIDDIISRRIITSLSRSEQSGIEHNIDTQYIKELFRQQGGLCFYSGVEMITSGSSSVSIDRIDSEGGYTKGNVVLCTAAINKMKNAYSMETFIDVCGKVWKHRGEF